MSLSTSMSTASAGKPTRIFYIYDRETEQDARLLQQLDRHLKALAEGGLIERWHAGLALAGDDLGKKADDALAWADLVLLLVSADSLNSDTCRGLVQRARDRGLRVVPVQIRSVDVQGHPLLSDAVWLPLSGKPVTLWGDLDEAFTAVAQGLRQLLHAAQPVAKAPLIGPRTTSGKALHIAMRLDRTKQWEQLKAECAQPHPTFFLLFGYQRQNLVFFLDRVRTYLAEERKDHHMVLNLPWERGGETSLTGADLLSRLNEELGRHHHGPQAALKDRLRQITALRPVLIIVGENPISELPRRRNQALADFLGRDLPAQLRDLGTQHPVRVLLCVDYIDPARSCVPLIASWAKKAAERKKDPGLRYCQLPEAQLPDWPEVERFLQGLEPPIPPKRIQKIRQKYDELHRMDTPDFHRIAQMLNTELGD